MWRAGEEKHHFLFSSPALFVLRDTFTSSALNPLVEFASICYTLHNDL